jgi:bacterioferritin-associated ferredoxin
VTFEDLSEAGVATLEEASERFGCGTKCGSCRPYITKMLLTGEIAFSIDADVSQAA